MSPGGYSDEFEIATAVYKGSGKHFFVCLAEQLDIPTEETKYDKNSEPCGERALTMDQLNKSQPSQELTTDRPDGILKS
ncbi:MAG: hypothetical protein AAFZ35_14080 [Cyanobacteria bacterium J06649_12]